MTAQSLEGLPVPPPLPPYAQLLNLRLEEQESGPVWVMPFRDDVVGRPGFLHGGAIAGLLEVACFSALQRALGERKAQLKPITVTVDYMRTAGDADTFAAAVVERLGARIANVEAYAWQSDRATPIASARLNFLLKAAAQ